MIEFATENDFQAIIRLWHRSFGDNDMYIERFLNMLFNSKNCLIYRETSSILSMLFLLDSKIVSNASIYPAYYVYAACTAPENRGQGIMSKLLKYAIDYSAREGKDFLCLAPADEHLFEYYSRFGFNKLFKRKEFTLSRSIMSQLSEDGAQPTMPSIEEVKLLRDQTLSTGNSLLWNEDIIEYAIEENKLSGGENIFVQKNGIFVGYVVYQVEKSMLIIKELCVHKHCFGLLTKIIVEKTQADLFQFSLPLDFPVSVDNLVVRDNGMILPLNSVGTAVLNTMLQAYVGFTLE